MTNPKYCISLLRTQWLMIIRVACECPFPVYRFFVGEAISRRSDQDDSYQWGESGGGCGEVSLVGGGSR